MRASCDDRFLLIQWAFLCLGGWGSLAAQDTSVVTLKNIEVLASRIDLTSVGKHSDRLDTAAWRTLIAPSLADLLQIQSPLYVRASGNGTLATLGMRGGSAAQTQVMWNGVPLRNPMIGLIDLSLIPAGLLDRAAIYYGGHGAAFGSGAMGGLLDIGSSLRRDADYIELSALAGSWSTVQGSVRLDYGPARLRGSTRYVYQQAKNDYRYKSSPDLPVRRQTHGALAHHAILQEAWWDLRKAGELNLGVWYQQADRQIPPTSVQTVSRAAQQDENFRAFLQWRKSAFAWCAEGRLAFLDETIDYQDSLILLYTSNRFKTWIAEGSLAGQLGSRGYLAGGLYTERVAASSGNYVGEVMRHQQAAYISGRIRTGSWIWRLQAREERTDGQWSPLLWDAGAMWEAGKFITAKTSLSRNYRIPTLNDLVWRPGGNPDLNPEKGTSWEAGVSWDKPGAHARWTGSVTGYLRRVEDWIMWLPPVREVRDYWSPVNIARVNSKGIETRMTWSGRAGQLSAGLDAGLDLTWSRFAGDIPDLGITSGDQMLYVPVENLMAGLRLGWRQFSLVYRHNCFGASPGINEKVQGANIGMANLGYRRQKAKVDLSVFLQVDNVWNVPYRYIERRPMPGRGVQAGVRIGWTGPGKHSAKD